MIKSKYNPTFKRISARVCTATFKVDNDKHFLFISGYAPHNQLPNEEKECFYIDLQTALKEKKANSIIILGLDANAKTHFNPETQQSKVLGH